MCRFCVLKMNHKNTNLQNEKTAFCKSGTFSIVHDEAAATGAGYSLLFFGGIISPGLQVAAGVFAVLHYKAD
jgi:hypothetical protein